MIKFFLFLITALTITSCGHLFYQPHQKLYTTPDKYQVQYQEYTIAKSNGQKLKAWLLKTKEKAKGTIIFFHGNAENRSTHFFQLAWLTLHKYQVFIVDYSGYGDSEGKATRENIAKDARITTEYALKHFTSPFIIYGQSLGGNIAVDSAAYYQDKISLLVLDSTFLSYQNIAFQKLKDSWLTFLLSPLAYILVNDNYAAINYIDLYKGNSLVLHGTADQVVPFKLGKEIYLRLKGKKDKIWFEGQNHIQAFANENNRKYFLKKLNSLLF